jgi:hypothetical protein
VSDAVRDADGSSAKRSQARPDVRLVDPVDLLGSFALEDRHPVGSYELNRARAFLAHVGEEIEQAPSRDMEAPAPSIENPIVVGQQAPQVRFYFGTAVGFRGQRKREGQGDGVRSAAVVVVVGECQPSTAPGRDVAGQAALEEHCELARLQRGFRPRSTIASMSPPALPAGDSGSPSQTWRFKAATVRRMRPTSARGLPCSSSMIHWRLTPTLLASPSWSKPSSRRLSRMARPSSRASRMGRGDHFPSRFKSLRTMTFAPCQRS